MIQTVMEASFGQLFQCPLVCTDLSAFTVPIPEDSPARVLLVSDTHLGATIDWRRSLDMFMEHIRAVIAAESITHICHLGDLCDGSLTNGAVVLPEALGRLNELGLPVFVIGGNHDRELYGGLKWPSDTNVTPVAPCNAMLIERGGLKLYLAHDLQNNYRIRCKFAFSFVTWLKEGNKKIRKEDWLIIGHTHTSIITPWERVGCIGQFSPEINACGYGIIDMAENVNIETKWKTIH